MMAADGRCKFGDANGDGYVRSEGVGIVVLKPLRDAVDDGDRIYAVIRGSAINNDGRSSGSMGTPSRSGQEELLRAAYADAGVSPDRSRTSRPMAPGTRVGDPVELAALGAVLSEGRAPGSRAYVGSVKTNIGHTEGAAGVAGLIKAALALHHGVHSAEHSLPGAQPGDSLGRYPVRDSRARALTGQARLRPRLAGVSAFGIAGTNGHVVLEQAAGIDAVPAGGPPPIGATAAVVGEESGGAARARPALRRPAVRRDRGPALHDVCWNAATRRTALDHRAVFVAADRAAMADALRRYASGEAAAAAEGVVHADASPGSPSCCPARAHSGSAWRVS